MEVAEQALPPLRRRLTNGVLAKGFSQGSQVFARLAEVPLFLAFWGSGLFGEWLLITAIPACLSLSDLGFAGAANRDMAMRVARGDRDGALGVFRSASLLILGLSLALAGFFVSLVALLPLASVLELSRIGKDTMVFAVLLLGLKFVVESQSRLLFGGFYCVRRYSRGFLVLGAVRIGQLLSTAFALMSGGGPIAVAAAMFGAELAGYFAMHVVLRRTVPWLSYGTSGVGRDMVEKLVGPAIAGMAIPLGMALSHQGVRLVIGMLLGPAAVVVFTTHRQLTRTVSFVVSLAHPVQAELSTLYDRANLAPFRRLARLAFRLLAGVVLGAAMVLAVMGGTVFWIWAAGEVAFDLSLFGLLLVAAVAESMWLAVFPPVIATNRHSRSARAYVLLNLTLILMVWFSAHMGLPTVAAILVVVEMVFFGVVLREAIAVTRDTYAGWLRAVLFPALRSEAR